MKTRNKVIPVLSPAGGNEEIAAVAKTIRSGWWGRGPKVEELEKKFVTFLKINGRVKPVYDLTTKSIISTIFIAENVFYM